MGFSSSDCKAQHPVQEKALLCSSDSSEAWSAPPSRLKKRHEQLQSLEREGFNQKISQHSTISPKWEGKTAHGCICHSCLTCTKQVCQLQTIMFNDKLSCHPKELTTLRPVPGLKGRDQVHMCSWNRASTTQSSQMWGLPQWGFPKIYDCVSQASAAVLWEPATPKQPNQNSVSS